MKLLASIHELVVDRAHAQLCFKVILKEQPADASSVLSLPI